MAKAIVVKKIVLELQEDESDWLRNYLRAGRLPEVSGEGDRRRREIERALSSIEETEF